MKKKLTAVICIIISFFLIAGIMCARYIRGERKAGEENYLLAAENVAYEINEYLETGEKEYFSRAAADIYQMSLMTDSADNIVSESDTETMEFLAAALQYNEDSIINEAERLYDAFKYISQNSEVEYAYAQIKIALSNCGL
ncbi:MAG: hypothetical protein ACI4F5_00815 [Acutalibacteraceae bacterium]